jgi:hypothetical protein
MLKWSIYPIQIPSVVTLSRNNIKGYEKIGAPEQILVWNWMMGI